MQYIQLEFLWIGRHIHNQIIIIQCLLEIRLEICVTIQQNHTACYEFFLFKQIFKYKSNSTDIDFMHIILY